MAFVYEVQADDISGLSDIDLTRLLKMLLHQEARDAGIAQRAVDVALNIRVGDGGEDGRVQWDGGPDQTDYLPARFVQFQNKATEMGPTACAEELIAYDTVKKTYKVKQSVDEALSAGAAYILFTTQALNNKQKNARIKKMRETLKKYKKSYADTADIKVYDAATIQGWVNRYAAAITAVLKWVGRPIFTGLQTWDYWEQYEENHVFPFIADEHRRKDIEKIREVLAQSGKSARIIGLSGLGKTRLALEVCRGDSDLSSLKSNVVYVNAGLYGKELPGAVAEWVQQKLKCILVVDNCELRLHQALKREIKHPESQISLLTMHFDPETDEDTPPLILSRMDDALIKSMLEPIYSERIPDLERVISFAQGFPQMAVLLAKARLDQTPDMGSLKDDILVQKMLWGGREKDTADEQMLRACALFEKFGLEDDAAEESKFIAEFVAKTDEDTLYECIKRFEKRGVVNTVGRYSQIIPKPLAIRMASDWWKHTRRKRQEELIESAMPGQLEDSFCDQIAKLDFLPEVKDLTAELCGIQGPFGQAEVILSDRGSRLFRALVEVNPIATSEALFRVFSTLDIEAMKGIGGDSRRHIVRALEKLCFRADTFEKASWMLANLAARENESWSNNATGQFIQLFRVFLSGTAAPPELRLRVIDKALASHDEAVRMLSIEALSSAIDTHGGSRAVGAEYQGSGAPLEEWRPTIWQEAFDYWIAALKRLTELGVQDTNEGKRAKKEIGINIRGLATKSRVLMDSLDESIHAIVRAHGSIWPEALESIKHTLSYDADGIPEDAKETLRAWENLLRPQTLEEKLRVIVSTPSFEHEKDAEGKLVDIAQINARNLAIDLANSLESLLPHLGVLLLGTQRQAYVFGRELVVGADKWEPVLSESLEFLKEQENGNPNFLMGMLSGVFAIDPNEWERLVEKFLSNKGLVDFYPAAIATGRPRVKHLNAILYELHTGNLNERSVSILAYGRNTDAFSPEEIADFTVAFSKNSELAGWVALDLLSMYCHADNERFDATAEAFKEILVNLRLDTEDHKRDQMASHHWKVAAKKLLSSGGESVFAVQLIDNLLSSKLSAIGYGDIHHAIQPVLRIVLSRYGKETWPLIGAAIVRASPSDRYRLAQMLGADDHSGRGKLASVLSELTVETLQAWCALEVDIAPIFVASTTEAFVLSEEKLQLSPTARFLIDEYGDSEEVLRALAANMGSFGWSGSVVPHLESEISAIDPIRNHSNENARNWAEQRIHYLKERIVHEKVRDAEQSIGIY